MKKIDKVRNWLAIVVVIVGGVIGTLGTFAGFLAVFSLICGGRGLPSVFNPGLAIAILVILVLSIIGNITLNLAQKKKRGRR